MQKKSILFLYSSTGFGGLVTNLSKIINILDRDKFEVTLVSLESNNPCAELLDQKLSTHVYELKCKGRWDFALIGQLDKIIKKHDVELINADGYKADFYAAIVKAKTGVRISTIMHGWVSKGLLLRLYQLLDKILFLYFDKIILLTPEQLRKHWFLKYKLKQISIIPNGVTVNDAYIQKTESKREWQNPLQISTCSRLVEEKQISILIKACALITEFDWQLKIIGDGSYRPLLEQLSKDLNVSDKVNFCGYKKNVLTELTSQDIFVTCSKLEGMPNALLEAAAIGLPIIASNIAEHKFIITNNENGLLFHLNEVHDLKKKIIFLKNNPELGQKLALNMFTKLNDNFSLELRKKRLEKFFLEN